MNKSISFFVSGEPRPFPKKRTGQSGMIYSYDPNGEKRGWMQNINLTAKEYMAKHNLEPFGEDDGIYGIEVPSFVGVQVDIKLFTDEILNNIINL